MLVLSLNSLNSSRPFWTWLLNPIPIELDFLSSFDASYSFIAVYDEFSCLILSISETWSKKLHLLLFVIFLSIMDAVGLPHSLLAAKFLPLIIDSIVHFPNRSDERSDRSEIGWRLQLSIFLPSISVWMMVRRRWLKVRRVSICVSCCELIYFCFPISYRHYSIMAVSLAF